MNVHATFDPKTAGLTRPNGDPLRLNTQDFVVIDRDRNAKYEATYRPQALYNRANNGFHANNETFLLHEVATNLPIYLPDTGPTDFHLHLPPGGFQLVLVTSGMFTFDYDGRLYTVGPGSVMLQSAIVHRQLFYTWSGLVHRREPEDAADGGAGRALHGLLRKIPRSLRDRSDDLSESDDRWSGPDQRSRNATCGLEPPTARSTGRCRLLASGPAVAGCAVQAAGRQAPSNRPCPFTCAISASRCRAVILRPATSSRPTRKAIRSCQRAPRRPWTPLLLQRARSLSIASFAARPNSGTMPERRSSLRPATW